MPPRRAKKKKVSDKQKGEQLLARLDEIRASPLPGNAAAFPPSEVSSICDQSRPNSEGFKHSIQIYMRQTLTGTISEYWISFMTGKGVAAGLRFSPLVSAQQIGGAIWFGLTDGFQMPWDELTEESIPEAIKKNPAAAAAANEANDRSDDDEEDVVEFHPPDSDFSKELKKANVKWMTIYLLNNQKDLLLRPWACRTNDANNIFPEDEDVVKVTTNSGKPQDYSNAAEEVSQLGQAAMRQVKLAISRQEAAIHPDSKYKGERAKWAP